VEPVLPNLFLIRLETGDFGNLRALLRESVIETYPPESSFPAFGCPQQTITVALHIL